MPSSALYEGTLVHARRTPVEHRFERPLYLHYLDLDEVADLRLGPLWSTTHPAPAWFRAADHLDGSRTPLAPRIRSLVREELGSAPVGPVRLLTSVRTWGWCFNPITLAYCFDATGQTVEAVVASVTNTPWGERTHYVLDARDGLASIAPAHKRLHVSPFAEMDLTYRFRLSSPDSACAVAITASRGDEQVLVASMRLARRELTARSTARMLVRHPLMSHRVSAGIHVEALRLWRKGAPLVPHRSQ